MPFGRNFAAVQAAFTPVHSDTGASASQDTAADRIHKTIQLLANTYAYLIIKAIFEGSWQTTAGDAIQCTAQIKFDGASQLSRTLRQTSPSVNTHVLHGILELKIQRQTATEITVTIGNGNTEVFARVLSVIIEGYS